MGARNFYRRPSRVHPGFYQARRRTSDKAGTDQFLRLYYQKGEEKRDNNRNGFYERDLLARYGLIEDIQVARDRKGEFESRVLPHYQRREEKIDRQIIDLFIGGISTRKM